MNEDQKKGQLPKDWVWTKFEDVCDIISGKNQAKVINPLGKYPIYGSSGIFGYADEYICEAETTIVGRKGTINSPLFVKTKFWNVDTAFGLSAKENYNNKLLYYFCLSFNFHNLDKSTTIPSLAKRDLLTINIPLPPKSTQLRIVSKIEELLSELDKGIENLSLAQQQLKTYRQSILKWAFEGRLTNANLKEGELPEGWKTQPLGAYIEDISSGKSYRCNERPPNNKEIGIAKVSSVSWGFFDEFESKTCFSNDLYNEKYLIRKGDFLFSRANTIELIGACVIVNAISKNLMLSDKILRFRFSKNILKEYVLYYLRSRKGRKQIEMLSTGNQDSMRNIGQEKIKKIELPHCSIEEQQLIVQALESRLSAADKMEETITQSLLQVETLRQSILKRAFEGTLF